MTDHFAEYLATPSFEERLDALEVDMKTARVEMDFIASRQDSHARDIDQVIRDVEKLEETVVDCDRAVDGLIAIVTIVVDEVNSVQIIKP